MTKELSKQICKFCGIKQKVDFGKPETLEKLCNLSLKSSEFPTVLDFIAKCYGEICDTNAFLKKIILALKSEYAYCARQAIREAEWKYE